MDSKIIWFLLGGGVGSAITYFLTKKHIQDVADAEIELIREVYSEEAAQKKAKKKAEEESKPTKITEPDRKIVEDIASRQGYRTPYGSYFNDSKSADTKSKMIEIIEPDKFGDIEEYSQINMQYFKQDDFLVYMTSGPRSKEDVVLDRDATIGPDALKNFGLYEDNYIHVVNYDRQAYYEIECIDDHVRFSGD